MFSYVDLWGTVTKIVDDGAQDDLPPDDDPQVQGDQINMVQFFFLPRKKLR